MKISATGYKPHLSALGCMALVLALTGCSTTRYIPCVGKDQAHPAEPERVSDKLTGKADEDVRIIAGSALRLRAWGQGLRDVIEGCREK